MDVNDLSRITRFMEAIQVAAAEDDIHLYGDHKLAVSLGPGEYAEIVVVYDETDGDPAVDSPRGWHLELRA